MKLSTTINYDTEDKRIFSIEESYNIGASISNGSVTIGTVKEGMIFKGNWSSSTYNANNQATISIDGTGVVLAQGSTENPQTAGSLIVVGPATITAGASSNAIISCGGAVMPTDQTLIDYERGNYDYTFNYIESNHSI